MNYDRAGGVCQQQTEGGTRKETSHRSIEH